MKFRSIPDCFIAIVRITGPSLIFPTKRIVGTGFITSVEVTDGRDTVRVNFLVTNKHIVSDWTLVDSIAKRWVPYIDVAFYSTATSKNIKPEIRRIRILEQSGDPNNKVFLEHENPTIDVCIILLNNDIMNDSLIEIMSFDQSYLLPFNSIAGKYFNIGSKVFVLGYPEGISSLRNSFPIAKTGLLASLPGQEFLIKIADTNRAGILTTKLLQGKLLIVDGLIVHGNSGGPVILPSEVKRESIALVNGSFSQRLVKTLFSEFYQAVWELQV